jgi:hypothetical protein
VLVVSKPDVQFAIVEKRVNQGPPRCIECVRKQREYSERFLSLLVPNVLMNVPKL